MKTLFVVSIALFVLQLSCHGLLLEYLKYRLHFCYIALSYFYHPRSCLAFETLTDKAQSCQHFRSFPFVADKGVVLRVQLLGKTVISESVRFNAVLPVQSMMFHGFMFSLRRVFSQNKDQSQWTKRLKWRMEWPFRWKSPERASCSNMHWTSIGSITFPLLTHWCSNVKLMSQEWLSSLCLPCDAFLLHRTFGESLGEGSPERLTAVCSEIPHVGLPLLLVLRDDLQWWFQSFNTAPHFLFHPLFVSDVEFPLMSSLSFPCDLSLPTLHCLADATDTTSDPF